MNLPNTQFRTGLRRASCGLSLVELLVAIAIGTVIVTAMALLFASSSRSRGETERASRNIENGRYALELLRGEFQHAGYFAEFDPRTLTLPADKPDACATTLPLLRAALGLHVQGYDTMAASTLSCLTDVKVGTDAFVARRASGCVVGAAGCTGLAAGAVAFQASSCGDATELANSDVANHYRLDTDTANLNRRRRGCTNTPPVNTLADTRRYVLRIYYVANNDRAGDGVPTLKVAELGAGGFVATSLVQGVENLQLEYGLDTNADGDADLYTSSPDLYLGCTNATNPTCVGHWASVVSVKAFVLSRSIEPAAGYTDTNSYVLGRKADGTANTFSPAGNYKRRVFQEVIRLQNAAGRRATA